MNIEDSKDPWNQGQKQVSVKLPGWLSALTLIVKVPFRLVFGTIGLLLGGARALNSQTSQFTDRDEKRKIGDAQYFQDVELYGRSEADFRVLNDIK